MSSGLMAQLGDVGDISREQLIKIVLYLSQQHMIQASQIEEKDKTIESLKQKVSQLQQMNNSGTTHDEISPNSQLGIKEAERNPGNVLNNNTPILKYCSDPNKCQTIVQMLMGCNSAKALKEAILTIDETGSMIDIVTMDTLQFCRDIIPLINYETNENALKQVIHRLRNKK